jgi:hypothetical protein
MLLWRASQGSQDGPVAEYHVARLDGSRHTQWSGGSPFWSKDSNVYEQLYNEDDAWIGLKNRKTGRLYRDPQLMGVSEVLRNRAFRLPQVNGALRSDVRPVGDVTICQTNLGSNMPVHAYTVKLPRTAIVLEALVAPDAQSILWVLLEKDASGFARFLSEHFPTTFGSSKASVTSLWISNIQGRDMREIGELSSRGPYPAIEPQLVRWVPGGRSLSFYYDNSLWTVPAK